MKSVEVNLYLICNRPEYQLLRRASQANRCDFKFFPSYLASKRLIRGLKLNRGFNLCNCVNVLFSYKFLTKQLTQTYRRNLRNDQNDARTNLYIISTN